jgi:hypothetical protein
MASMATNQASVKNRFICERKSRENLRSNHHAADADSTAG